MIVLALLGAIAYLVYQRFNADPTRDAVAGDCLADLPVDVGETPVTVNSARVVACTDPDAAFRIEGRLDSVSEAQARSDEICRAYEEAALMYSVVPPGRTGYVLCLSRVE